MDPLVANQDRSLAPAGVICAADLHCTRGKLVPAVEALTDVMKERFAAPA